MSDRDLRLEDARSRRLAQADFTRPLVLEAGAGTGKTATLVARVATWALTGGWEKVSCQLGAAAPAARVAERVLADGLPPRTFLNINVPRRVTHGLKVTLQAKRTHATSISERVDPKHRPYYWIDEAQDEWEADERSDYQAVRAGYISITPLQPDLTAHRAIRTVERLLGASSPPARKTRRPGPEAAGKKSLGKARGVR